MPPPVTTPRANTYSAAHIGRQRDAHARADGYGRHRHLYLNDTMRRLAAALGQVNDSDQLSWLDYGCGKGGFIEQIRPLGLFATICGHDPAVDAFRDRPSGRFDLVTCLDVIDIVEGKFQDAVVADVAGFTAGLALFDCLTRPKPGNNLRPHPPFHWAALIGRHMAVQQTNIEFNGMEGFERAVVIAAPRDRA